VNALVRAHLRLLAAWLAVTPSADVPEVSGELERLRVLAWQRLLDAQPPPAPEADVYLTIPQVAERLRLSKSFCYELTRRGILPSHQLGQGQRGLRVHVAELIAWEATRVKDST
jgi:excisionase family DNA binding protein